MPAFTVSVSPVSAADCETVCPLALIVIVPPAPALPTVSAPPMMTEPLLLKIRSAAVLSDKSMAALMVSVESALSVRVPPPAGPVTGAFTFKVPASTTVTEAAVAVVTVTEVPPPSAVLMAVF